MGLSCGNKGKIWHGQIVMTQIVHDVIKTGRLLQGVPAPIREAE